MPRMTVKKRNPQDSTLRNIQSANRRLEALTIRVRRLEIAVRDIARLIKYER